MATLGSDKHPTFPDYSFLNGLLIYFDGLKSRVCVPTSLRGRLLEICHDSPSGGHTGARKLKYEMLPQFFLELCITCCHFLIILLEVTELWGYPDERGCLLLVIGIIPLIEILLKVNSVLFAFMMKLVVL